MKKKIDKEREDQLLREGEDAEREENLSQSRRLSEEEENKWDQRSGLQMISIRLPHNLVHGLKEKAQELGIGYQPLIRQILFDYLGNPRLESFDSRLSQIEERMKEFEKKLG